MICQLCFVREADFKPCRHCDRSLCRECDDKEHADYCEGLQEIEHRFGHQRRYGEHAEAREQVVLGNIRRAMNHFKNTNRERHPDLVARLESGDLTLEQVVAEIARRR